MSQYPSNEASVPPTSPEQSVIQVRGVTKNFRRKLALDHVDLDVPSGKVFALLGENGAGKTTLIKILTGFLKPDSGFASVLSHDCQRNARTIRRQIGYVSDAPPLYHWMTPSEIGWFTSAFYDEGFLAQFNQQMEDFGVPIETKIGSLSKGQRAKVALALATAHQPRLLILDEPTSGLDPIVRRQFLESMVDQAAAGQTVFLSSHLINEVERVADMVAIVHEGKIRLVQPLETLKADTSIVTVTLDDAHVESPLPKGERLSCSSSGRQKRWVVRGLAENWQQDFASDPGVRHFTSEKPTLEEIFVAVCDPTGHVKEPEHPEGNLDMPLEPSS